MLLGLGLGCTPPAPSKKTPYYIGVVLAERWTTYKHGHGQRYVDSFDRLARARGNIKWLVAQGDLITQDEGIQVSQAVVKKLSRNGNRAGTLTLVFAETGGASEPPTQFAKITGGTFVLSGLFY